MMGGRDDLPPLPEPLSPSIVPSLPESEESDEDSWPETRKGILEEFLLYGALGSSLAHFTLSLRSIEEMVVTLKHDVMTPQFRPVNGGYEPPEELLSNASGMSGAASRTSGDAGTGGERIELLVTAYEGFDRPVVWFTSCPDGCEWAKRTEVYFDSVEDVYSGRPFLYSTLENLLSYCGIEGNVLDLDSRLPGDALRRTKLSALLLHIIRGLPPPLAERYVRERTHLITTLLLGHMSGP